MSNRFFEIKSGNFVASEKNKVNNVNLKIENQGEIVSLLGPSGVGKTTVLRTIAGLQKLSSGEIFLKNKLISSKNIHIEPEKRNIALSFQDNSMFPNYKVIDNINFGKKRLNGNASAIDADEIIKLLHIEPILEKYPHQFSGGQRQRIGITRALSINPEFIICDEPVSALDVSVQAQILNLLVDLKNEFNLSYLFIAHDLSVVKYISDKIIVMYLGKILEIASSSDIYESPQHPYTEALLAAVSKNEAGSKREILLKGNIPDPSNPPSGCVLHPRCSYAKDECMKITPELIPITGKPNAFSACHFTNDLNLKSFI